MPPTEIIVDQIIEDAAWSRGVLQDLHAQVTVILSDRPSSAGTAQLIAATTAFKNEIKTANSSGRIKGRKMPATGSARFLPSAIQKMSADFRMRADTDPSRAEWRQTLGEMKFYLEDYIARIRKECPEAG